MFEAVAECCFVCSKLLRKNNEDSNRCGWVTKDLAPALAMFGATPSLSRYRLLGGQYFHFGDNAVYQDLALRRHCFADCAKREAPDLVCLQPCHAMSCPAIDLTIHHV